ncbi:MAG: hypothetical protein WDO71_25820 [Bacteroidota bacterium]
MKYFLKTLIIFSFLLIGKFSLAQYTHEDTLRGSITPERAGWDVLRYDIKVKPDFSNAPLLKEK